ncbi:hypothetical protein BC939DRAFT_473241 [Gamsiella multidivaricata]|uniref:uncharacterized protein n=1 Tax=Gamsiella multidivaricata TaxID=101098 RepID=UPI00221EA6A7|nr:uncharacterized protein BC939DRAFT_473241 [Gamsiella multidivaricata]KAI7831177.1 hypothetical protein BC939DRAFT_473241 [Gamsiella multidivaricata]
MDFLDQDNAAPDEVTASSPSIEDKDQDATECKKKTLSTSSISSTISTSSSTASSSTSSSLFSLTAEAAITAPIMSHPSEDVLASQLDQSSDLTEIVRTVHQEDIKEVQIETEDPSHLFWVPFHMHPEIAPNEYNRWLSKHGVDTDGSGSLLSARKESLNRRKSVLSAQYNPEEDDDDDEDTDEKAEQKKPVAIKEDEKQQDFLSGVFSSPLTQMGEPPLKTRTSLRRSTSHTQLLPHVGKLDHEAVTDMATDMAEEDLAAVKRGSGLTRHGPSLLRRSARTKIRRNSTTSSEIRNDVSRLRPVPIENGEYPAVRLVDPGPMPLTSTIVQPAPASVVVKQDEVSAHNESAHRPLKRFVSTLRDSSKPTITTYVEPQLLEQRRREIEEESRSDPGVAVSSITTTITVATADAMPLQPSSSSAPACTTFEDAVTSKVTYPIPPPVKLSQNLLQQHTPPQPAPSKPAQLSQKHTTSGQKDFDAARLPPVQPHLKKSSSWSWLWGKEKGGDKTADMAQRPQKTPISGSQVHQHNRDPSTEIVGKKQSALSLLFSRNGKGSSKPQPASPEDTATSSTSHQQSSPQGDRANDPRRMPIHIERAIYRLSHVKLANPRRPLHEQVLISNMMFWYLSVIQEEQDQQQQQQQQQQQPLQVTIERNTEFVNADRDAAQVMPNRGEELKKKKPHQDTPIAETKVEGSEHVVPQQDSNSHARSPGKEMTIQENTHIQSMYNTSARNDADYDEESMIGGGFSGDFDWSDDEGDDDTKGLEDGAGSLYLQDSAQDTNSYRMNSIQSGASSISTVQGAVLTDFSESRRPGTVSVS